MKPLVELTVEGMDCANCAAGITRYLERKGLEEVYVNFQTKEVRFRLVDESISLEEAKGGINKLGYTVVEPEQKPDFWTLERKLLIGAIFTLPLLLGHLLMSAGIHLAFMHNAWIQLAICLPVFVLGAWHFGKSAWSSIRNGMPNMDVLIFMGGTAAFVYSLVGTLSGETQYIFYETSATIFTLVLLGNWIEKRAVAQTTTAIAELGKLQVEHARRIMPSGTIVGIHYPEIKTGYILQVNEGDKVPADGEIFLGQASIDESMLTGESLPINKQLGDQVIGGSLVLSGNFQLKVNAVGKKSVLGQMIELIKTAQQDKPEIQRLADKISAIFVPVVVSISALTFLLSYFVFDIAFKNALMNAIAVLVISCPCAMGLATPTAVMVGVGRLARNGILVKGGKTLEIFANIRNIVFDKTGTLTTGTFVVEHIDYAPGVREAEVNNLIYDLEMHSSHPIAKSLVQEMEAQVSLNGQRLGPITLTNVEEEKGKGMSGEDEAGNIYEFGASENGQGTLILRKNGDKLATLSITDTIKPEAKACIDYLKSKNIASYILSGDKQAKTASVAEALGVTHFFAEQQPGQKLDIIARLSKEAPTAMVGDGINDAPALAKASIGVSLSNASQAAIQSAQIVLLNGNLERLPQALAICTHTVLTIKQSLYWAFAYNIVAIPMAAMGYLNPMWGALFMAFSDVVVIGNAIRLKYKRI
ncbi:heavy metal translocating P-type ATPase [Haliscomenobacter hydrossis]|uniref:Heavy metal translocating P-type ATPase n=1 Tax=Haliscomenobacter hydrossis (strain ATCC 27775 / DSM 1100 / LMG 10767 / O) TaxID=760192 RepID=F4KTV0_HALH1|nr:cation-translocating P-type ATPase [Haliscomenobacter hydrossis]AEE48094.1 heavy metal translocating P-type ATPase [Haliscomenobacter hydrossis DSM 1100]